MSRHFIYGCKNCNNKGQTGSKYFRKNGINVSCSTCNSDKNVFIDSEPDKIVYSCDCHMYNCCDCGGHDCGCGYCWSCNACEECLDDDGFH